MQNKAEPRPEKQKSDLDGKVEMAEIAFSGALRVGDKTAVKKAVVPGGWRLRHVFLSVWEMVPAAGFEPATFGLQNRCTTTVLSRPETERGG